MLSFTRTLSPISVPAYAAWRLGGKTGTVTLRLRDGPRFLLRSPTAPNNDYGVAYEVFVHRFYDLPSKASPLRVRRIVDLGANVGFTCLHWLWQYPAAQLIAFEPHPDHAAQCRANLELNHFLDGATVHACAAGARRDRMYLSDEGTSSRLMENGGSGMQVEVVDAFETLGTDHIDILKMDIEGGEYALLGDARFAELDIGQIVLEWHARADGAQDRQWCIDRLTQCGFDVTEIFVEPTHGMLRAGRA